MKAGLPFPQHSPGRGCRGLRTEAFLPSVLLATPPAAVGLVGAVLSLDLAADVSASLALPAPASAAFTSALQPHRAVSVVFSAFSRPLCTFPLTLRGFRGSKRNASAQPLIFTSTPYSSLQ